MQHQLPADVLSDILRRIYPCRYNFTLQLVNQQNKHRLGTYFPSQYKIIIYVKGRNWNQILETAIHEYAHHIHDTEHYHVNRTGADTSHGEHFWRIYSALRVNAIRRGILNDPLIQNIYEGI